MTTEATDNRIGGCIHFFSLLDSTNTTAYYLAQRGLPEGNIVIADAQSKGRGRLDRTWQSPPGRNLYLSIVLRPPIPVSHAPQITLMAGVAVADLLSAYCPGKVVVKWPNDILINGKKICGILTEMKSSPTGVDFIILGIGININMTVEDFDPELRDTATSLRIETGAPTDRLAIAGKLFQLIEKWYGVFLLDGFKGIRDAFLSYANLEGKPIQVVFKNDVQTGVATGIDEDGSILLKDREGVLRRIMAGDVSIMKG